MKDKKRVIAAEDLLRINVVNDPQFSTDGQFFTYTLRTINDNKDYQNQIFIQDVNENNARQLTYGNANNHHPRISPDGKRMAFISNRSGYSQIWLLPLTGGEARQLTFVKNGVSEPFWSPDGKFLLFAARLEAGDDVNQIRREPTDEEKRTEKEKQEKQVLVVNRMKYKSDAEGFHDHTWKQLVLYDMETDTFHQLTKEAANHEPGCWSPDSKMFAFTANLEPDADLKVTRDVYTIHIETKNIEKLTDAKGTYTGLSFSPNGDLLACLGHEFEFAGASLSRLWTIDVHTKEKICITKAHDIQLGDVMVADTVSSSNPGPVWSSDGRSVFVTANQHGNTGLYRIHLNGEMKAIYGNNHVYTFCYDHQHDQLITGISDPLNPGDLYLIKDNKVNQITEVNKEFLAEVHLLKPEPVDAEAEDGLDIHGWIMKPTNYEEGNKYPLVLEIHGGPHAMYGQTFFLELQLLAAQGYGVLYTNPRGSHGYGQSFVDACRSDYGGKDYTDLMTVVEHVVENNNWIDESRLGVTGGSYGGFMTNWMVSHTNRFKAAVTQRSISNWLSFYGVSDIGFYFTEWEIGNQLLENPEKLWTHSPLKYAQHIETPLLILHGEKDFRCPIEQAEQLFITMKQLGKEVEFVRFPGASHELSRSGDPTLRVERLNRIVGWFDQYLQ